MKIEYAISYGCFAGAMCRYSIEVEDDASQEKIDAIIKKDFEQKVLENCTWNIVYQDKQRVIYRICYNHIQSDCEDYGIVLKGNPSKKEIDATVQKDFEKRSIANSRWEILKKNGEWV